MKKENNRAKEKKQTNTLLKGFIVLLVVALMILLLMLMIETKNAYEGNSFEEKNISVRNEVIINTVTTPIVDFVYGFEAVDNLKISYNLDKPYDVVFLADIEEIKNVEILKFYFDEAGKGISIGTIRDNNGHNVKVSVEEIKFDDLLGLNEEEKTRLSYVQEDLLDIIVSNFDIVEYATEDVRFVEENILIETPYVKIPFSRELEEHLAVEIIEGTPYKVVFSCKFEDGLSVELFTYSFDEGVEDVVGYLNDIPVGLSAWEIEADENWKLDDIDIFYSMRDEMNYILDYLLSTGEFKLK